MAQFQQTLPLTGAWSLITDADVTQLSFQAKQGDLEIRRGTTDAPADTEGGWLYEQGFGERNLTLDALSGAAGGRVWARAAGLHPAATILVDHA